MYCPYGNIINFSRTSRIHFSYKIRHWNYWANGAKRPQNPPLLEARGPPCNTGWPHSPSQTTARSLHALPHNYATKAPLVTMLRSKFTPQNTPCPSTITTPSNTPIPRPTVLTIPNGIRIQPAVLPQYTLLTDRQTKQSDRPTERPTDGPGECSVKWALRSLCW